MELLPPARPSAYTNMESTQDTYGALDLRVKRHMTSAATADVIFLPKDLGKHLERPPCDKRESPHLQPTHDTGYKATPQPHEVLKRLESMLSDKYSSYELAVLAETHPGLFQILEMSLSNSSPMTSPKQTLSGDEHVGISIVKCMSTMNYATQNRYRTCPERDNSDIQSYEVEESPAKTGPLRETLPVSEASTRVPVTSKARVSHVLPPHQNPREDTFRNDVMIKATMTPQTQTVSEVSNAEDADELSRTMKGRQYEQVRKINMLSSPKDTSCDMTVGNNTFHNFFPDNQQPHPTANMLQGNHVPTTSNIDLEIHERPLDLHSGRAVSREETPLEKNQVSRECDSMRLVSESLSLVNNIRNDSIHTHHQHSGQSYTESFYSQENGSHSNGSNCCSPIVGGSGLSSFQSSFSSNTCPRPSPTLGNHHDTSPVLILEDHYLPLLSSNVVLSDCHTTPSHLTLLTHHTLSCIDSMPPTGHSINSTPPTGHSINPKPLPGHTSNSMPPTGYSPNSMTQTAHTTDSMPLHAAKPLPLTGSSPNCPTSTNYMTSKKQINHASCGGHASVIYQDISPNPSIHSQRQHTSSCSAPSIQCTSYVSCSRQQHPSMEVTSIETDPSTESNLSMSPSPPVTPDRAARHQLTDSATDSDSTPMELEDDDRCLKGPVRPIDRPPMRQWLVEQLEKNEVPGLEWADKEQLIFRVPWKHGSRHGWTMEQDAGLFVRWAKYTGGTQG